MVLSLTRQFASEARPRFSTHTQVVVGLRGYSGSAREENSNTSKEKNPVSITASSPPAPHQENHFVYRALSGIMIVSLTKTDPESLHGILEAIY
ncbi:hypothetical protein HYQ44_012951 [Verticillium longisporum]|nr:hypothetical protein HYQ44_012951 [Verticillium longisporum]